MSFIKNLSMVLLFWLSSPFSLETVTGMEEKLNKKIKASEHEKKVLAKNTGYRTSEIIEKAPTEDHPCMLKRTSERIFFPALKNELFVNILGYREPNLVHVMRCKGVCGELDTPFACRAVKIQEKKVMMTFKTNSSGRDSKYRIKELILDDHVECGCKCLNRAGCAGRFNDLTCECECDDQSFGEEKTLCEGIANTYWDSSVCQCRSKSVAPRGLENQNMDCGRDTEGVNIIEDSIQRGFDMIQYLLIGAWITVSVVLASATFHYRRKVKQLKRKLEKQATKKLKKPKKTSKEHPRSASRNFSGTNGAIPNKVSNNYSIQAIDDIEAMMRSVVMSPSGGELYHEQYNEHGVRIERKESDDELINRYIHNV